MPHLVKFHAEPQELRAGKGSFDCVRRFAIANRLTSLRMTSHKTRKKKGTTEAVP